MKKSKTKKLKQPVTQTAPDAAVGRKILAGIAHSSGRLLNGLLEELALALHAMNETADSLGLTLPEYLNYLATPETAAQIRGAVVSARAAEILRAAQAREAGRSAPAPTAAGRLTPPSIAQG